MQTNMNNDVWDTNHRVPTEKFPFRQTRMWFVVEILISLLSVLDGHI